MSTNLFKRLKAILPDSPLLTGTVMLDFGDGTVQVALAGSNGQVRVRNPNQLALNSTVYVKAGVATEAAPDLPYVYIEV